jgi:SlyX protein
MNEKRFQVMEEKLAFLEMTNADMSEEIFRQQQEIEVLTRAHQTLLKRIDVLQASADQDIQGNNERPPHY